ncbi:MAG: hypothetical protein ACMUIP_14730, partial [bacterium]
LKYYISSKGESANGSTTEFYSELVKDTIYLCKTKESKQRIEKEHPDKAVFLPSEIKIVSKLKPEEVKKIHLLKQHFGGIVLPKSKSKDYPRK